MTDILLKQKTRIFTPTEYEKLRAVMNERYQIVCDAMLLTGMRPVEFKRFQPSWYRGPRRCIELPPGACLKDKCEYKERTIKLSLPGCEAVEKYLTAEVKFKGKMVPVRDLLPEKVSMRDTLRRYAITSGIGDEGVTPKAFRKSLVSWLVACFPERSLYIQSSMGHNADTIVHNYMGITFLRDEIEKMRNKYLVEWGIQI